MKYVIASAILFAGFAVLALLVLQNNVPVSAWDRSTFVSVNNPSGKTISKIMVEMSKYGREAVWIGITALLFIIGRKDGRKAAVLLTIAFLILIPLGTILKSEVDRPRPTSDNLLVPPETDASFPSGHAVIVSAGATILLLRFNRGKQIIASIILAIEAALVAYSRVYVGAHYPLDVVGGILLGTAVACAVVASSKYLGPIFSRIDSMKR
ncbi:Undecaprenyl-diphosphatase [Nitrosotalea devaniterrae]|uniref:Undecaprenyl-diphosphatase n=1 Tax=Nitrosotalea devaniterrae TaxID=1078905 RepID=A0A128A429_9ARCH|nr:Undecaprenyl-diphosphatase [Candidatus Nitrosotalea devanaterra]